jgi:thioredoxin-dependent peroxiredoxin
MVTSGERFRRPRVARRRKLGQDREGRSPLVRCRLRAGEEVRFTMSESSIRVGTPAPAFTLPDQDGRSVSSDELRGSWVVLYFYPKDDTPGCTTEACEFTAGIAAFQQLDAVVLGCSPDSPAKHRAFIAKHGLRLRLLADEGREVLKAYGAWGEKKMYGRSSEGVIRSTVIIDPDGRVAAHWPTVKAAGHAEAVRQRLAELRAG